MALEQPFAIPSAAWGVGATGGRIARPAVVHNGTGAVGRGVGAGRNGIHQQTGPGHGQTEVPFLSLRVSRTTKEVDQDGVAVPALPAAALITAQPEKLLAGPEAMLDRPAQAKPFVRTNVETCAILGEPCPTALRSPSAMPAPLHVQLAPRQRRRLMELRRDPGLASRERDRVEMYLLSADGMTVPALARHFGRCEATMRRWIRQFEEEGLKAVRHRQLGTGPDLERRREVRRALNGLLSRKRTWTAAQLAEALAEEKGIVMRPPTVRKYLHLMGASYRRTKYSLRHRQDPERAAAAGRN